MPNDIFYIIIPITDKNIFLKHNGIAELILHRLVEKKSRMHEIDLYCYSLLPGALHMVFQLSGSYDKTVNYWIASFKRKTGRDIKTTFHAEIRWGKGFSMEHIKNSREFNTVLQGIHEGPEKLGITENGHDYGFARFIKNPVF